MCGNEAAVRWVDGEASLFEGYDAEEAWSVHMDAVPTIAGISTSATKGRKWIPVPRTGEFWVCIRVASTRR